MYMVSRHGWAVEGESERPAFWKAAVLLLLPVGLIVFPVVLHNVRYNEPAVGKQPKPVGFRQFFSTGFLPIASNLGINFYLGNHWELREINNINHPEHFVYYHRIENEPAENGVEGALSESRYLVRQTVSHIFEKPADFIRLMGLKVYQLFNGAEVPRNANLYAFRQYSVVLRTLLWKSIIAFPSGLIIPLGLVGIFLSRNLWRKHFLLFGCLAVQYLFILAFFVTARYRLPTIPLLAIYTAFALEAFIHYVRQGAKTKAAIPVVLLVVLVLFSNSPMGRIETEHGYSEYLNLGNALHDEGKIGQAVLCFNETLKLAPNYPKAHYNLANALTDKGMLSEAVTHYNKALELQPDYLEAQSNLAKALAKQGRLREAIEIWERLVQINPAESVLHSNLGTAYHRLGQFDRAIMHWNQVLHLTPNHVSVLNKLAWLLATCQDDKYRDPVRAVKLAHRGCRLTAYRQPKLLDSLAAAYARAGRFGQAVETAERALEVARLSGAKQLEDGISRRMEMYRRKQAYYETVTGNHFKPLN
jgi:tetratricopeptide (TPR) repeat protein